MASTTWYDFLRIEIYYIFDFKNEENLKLREKIKKTEMSLKQRGIRIPKRLPVISLKFITTWRNTDDNLYLKNLMEVQSPQFTKLSMRIYIYLFPHYYSFGVASKFLPYIHIFPAPFSLNLCRFQIFFIEVPI